jgi:hypothetical protein
VSLRYRWAIWVGLVIVIVLAVAPFYSYLGFVPAGDDAHTWLTRPTGSDGWTWILKRRHFIGYRPVTAASFRLMDAVFGGAVWPNRALDLSLHGAAVALVFFLFRSLTKDAGGFSLAAAGLFALHPAAAQVPTFMARRSYSLAVVFGLLAVLAAVEADRRRSWPLTFVAAVAAPVCMLSNELGYVAVILLPLAVIVSNPPERHTALRILLVMATAGLAWLRRVLVRKSLVGGYPKQWMARPGNSPVQIEGDHRAEIFGTAWEYTVCPISVGGDACWMPLGPIVLAVGLVWLVVSVVWLSWVLRERSRYLGALLLLWVVTYGALFAVTGSWFWRLGYAMVVPFAMLVSWSAWAGWRVWPHQQRMAHLAGLALLLPSWVGWAPAFGGLETGRLVALRDARPDRVALEASLQEIALPAKVGAVLNMDHKRAMDVARHLRRTQPSLKFDLLAYGRDKDRGRLPAQMDGDDLVIAKFAEVTKSIKFVVREQRVALDEMDVDYLWVPGEGMLSIRGGDLRASVPPQEEAEMLDEGSTEEESLDQNTPLRKKSRKGRRRKK